MPSNVLVIEDEPDIRKTIDYNLSKESFKVIQAASIEEGEKALASNKIDVIILDLMLPDGSGLTLCRDIKSEPKTKNIPVINDWDIFCFWFRLDISTKSQTRTIWQHEI